MNSFVYVLLISHDFTELWINLSHVEIESEALVVRNPEVTVKHQPESTATLIYEPKCGKRHVCFLFLYFRAVGIRGGMLKPISCICESAQQLDRGQYYPR